eukprot:UN29030
MAMSPSIGLQDKYSYRLPVSYSAQKRVVGSYALIPSKIASNVQLEKVGEAERARRNTETMTGFSERLLRNLGSPTNRTNRNVSPQFYCFCSPNPK